MGVNGYLSINAVSDQEENLMLSTLLRNVLSCVLGNVKCMSGIVPFATTVMSLLKYVGLSPMFDSLNWCSVLLS